MPDKGYNLNRMIQYLKYSFFLLTLVGLVACDADSDSSQTIIPAHASAMTAPQVAAAGASGTQLAGSIAVNKVADDKKKTKDATKKKDYWAKIPFTMANFEEVREYVRTYYIDGKINESRAFAEACNQALFGMKAPRQLLPAAFHSARKKHADEEGGLSGKTYKITAGDKYLVHVLPKVDDKKKKAKKAKKKKKKNTRLSNEEIMELRKKSKERRTLLETEWSKIAFEKKDLARCLAHIEIKSGIAQTSPKFKKFHFRNF